MQWTQGLLFSVDRYEIKNREACLGFNSQLSKLLKLVQLAIVDSIHAWNHKVGQAV